MTPRIAVGGIHTECSTYSPVTIAAGDFRVLRGDELVADPYFAFLSRHPARIASLLHARAVPGGPVERAAYDAFKAEFFDRLDAAGTVDAVYLAMHGAMTVEGMEDAEGDWIATLRDRIGPEKLIAVSYDLHGNVSQAVTDAIDIFAAYRTAPHIDVEPTMEAAFAMLLRALAGGERPGVVRATVPLLLPGERSATTDDPARRLYAALPGHEGAGVWRADLMIGYVWADQPRATACAMVTGTDRAAAMRASEAIAHGFWDAREDFAFGVTTGTLEDMLDRAAGEPGPVILADSGDNPTGGGVGDRADVLAALIARDWQGALVAGITDAPAVAACRAAGEGAERALRIGASLDPAGGQVSVTARVLRLAGDQAVVQIGGITVVLAEKRRPYHHLADFARLGLDPRAVQMLVVKSGYLSPELAPLASPALMALTPGVVDQDIARLPNLHRPPGTLPFEPRATFSPCAEPSARFRP